MEQIYIPITYYIIDRLGRKLGNHLEKRVVVGIGLGCRETWTLLPLAKWLGC